MTKASKLVPWSDRRLSGQPSKGRTSSAKSLVRPSGQVRETPRAILLESPGTQKRSSFLFQ